MASESGEGGGGEGEASGHVHLLDPRLQAGLHLPERQPLSFGDQSDIRSRSRHCGARQVGGPAERVAVAEQYPSALLARCFARTVTHWPSYSMGTSRPVVDSVTLT